MLSIKNEISAGGVVFRRHNSGLEVALTSREKGKIWCLPKGQVEQGESLEQTALREVREETGLQGNLIQKLDEIRYWYYSKWEKTRVSKLVHFYLMECLGGNTKDHDSEVDEVRWYPLEEAKQILSYKDERQVAEKAELILKGGENSHG